MPCFQIENICSVLYTCDVKDANRDSKCDTCDTTVAGASQKRVGRDKKEVGRDKKGVGRHKHRVGGDKMYCCC